MFYVRVYSGCTLLAPDWVRMQVEISDLRSLPLGGLRMFHVKWAEIQKTNEQLNRLELGWRTHGFQAMQVASSDRRQTKRRFGNPLY